MARKMGLAGKFNALSITMILLTATVISIIVIKDEREESYQQLVEKGVTLAGVAAGNAEYGVYTENALQLGALLGTFSVDDDIAYAVVFDRLGNVLKETRFAPGEYGDFVLPEELSMPPSSGAVPVFPLIAGRAGAIEIIVPVISSPEWDIVDYTPGEESRNTYSSIGYLLVVVGTESVEARMREFLRNTLLSTTAIICLGLFATLYLTRRIVSPLNDLHLVANDIAEGRFDRRVDVHSEDEIGGLSTAFNRMANHLKAYQIQVDDHTEELREAKEEVEQQNVDLRKLDKLKDAFIYAVSHELKTPVAKHAMQLEILKPALTNHTLSKIERNAVVIMEESIKRQQRIIRSLLDLARLESGRVEYKNERVDLETVINSVRKDYQYALDAYEVEFQLEGEFTAIWSDENMLWHVFSNLLNNSLKFRKRDGSAFIRVSSEPDGQRVNILVEDNGIGMTKDEVEKCFSRFFQGSDSIEGSGVGLSISRMIVEGLGGKLALSSPGRGKGTVATVTLPLTATAEESVKAPA